MKFFILVSLILALAFVRPVAARMTPQEAELFALGFLEGLGEEADYSACINDVEAIIVDVENAYADAKSKHIVKFFHELGTAIDKLDNSMTDCKNVAELKKIAHEFKHPKDLIYHAGKALWFHHHDILKEFKASTTAYKHGNFRAAGKAAGEIAGKLVKAAPMEDIMSGFDAKLAEKFTLGLVEGLGVEFDYSQCINDVEGIVTDLVNAYGDAKSKHISQFFHELGEAMDTIDDALSACKQIDELKKIAEEFKHPKDLIYHAGKALWFHHHDIIKEFEATVTAWDSADYRAAGQNVGKIIGVMVAAPTPLEAMLEDQMLAITRSQLGQLILGIAEGIGHTIAGDDFDNCLHGIEHIWADLEAAWASVTSHDVKTFFHKLGKALEEIAEAIKPCGTTIVDFEKAAKVFTGGWLKILWHAGKSLVMNGKEIYGFFEEARSSWHSGRYEHCGEAIGDIIATVL